MSEIKRTIDWFIAAGQMPPRAEPNTQQTGFYLGMQLEELSEKLAAVMGTHSDHVKRLHHLALAFKNGLWDDKVSVALRDPKYAEELLDADMDMLWVTIGAAAAQGADVPGAYNAVGNANWAKFEGGVRRDPTTGKVLKPEGWRPPDLKPFMHPLLRHGAGAD